MSSKVITYSRARLLISDADLLLWRPTTCYGWVIAQLGRGRHCHASKTHWVTENRKRRLLSLGTEEGRNGVRDYISELVVKYPGKIDLYQANPGNRWPEFDRAGSIAWTLQHLDAPYGWWATIRAALSRMPIVRLLPWFNPILQDEANGTHPPNCSALCSMSDRIGGGVDPVKGLADFSTEPVDLERSPFYKYVGTLVPDDWEVKP